MSSPRLRSSAVSSTATTLSSRCGNLMQLVTNDNTSAVAAAAADVTDSTLCWCHCYSSTAGRHPNRFIRVVPLRAEPNVSSGARDRSVRVPGPVGVTAKLRPVQFVAARCVHCDWHRTVIVCATAATSTAAVRRNQKQGASRLHTDRKSTV